MIPKKIFTIWLSYNPEYPPLIKKCIDSQKIDGYEHKVITLDNYYKGSKYVNEALLMAQKTGETSWLVKASDWLRCYHIWRDGGIYLDADMEVLEGKNFDDMLNTRMFIAKETTELAANSAFGAEKGYPFLKEYLDFVEANFRGDGPVVFEPGVRAFTDLLWLIKDKEAVGIKVYGNDVFFPYMHGTEQLKVTPNTRVYHHFALSWTENSKL